MRRLSYGVWIGATGSRGGAAGGGQRVVVVGCVWSRCGVCVRGGYWTLCAYAALGRVELRGGVPGVCGKRCLGQRGGVGASRGSRVDDFFGFAWGCSLLYGTEPVQSLLVFDLAVAELFVFGQENMFMFFRCERTEVRSDDIGRWSAPPPMFVTMF